MSRRSSIASNGGAVTRRARARSKRAQRDAGGRLLHLDLFSGIAGNMFLGAMLDLGLPRAELLDGISGLPLEFKLRVKRVERGALAARYVEVAIPGRRARPRRTARADSHSHSKSHSHAHSHDVAEPQLVHDHSGGRSYREVVAVIEAARLAPAVKDRALAIFEALGRAEAKVHGRPLAEVHFHEVGAVDAMVDVVGAAVGLERLGITRVSATPVALGHGSIETAHGLLPLPAPATLELLAGIPTVPAHVAWETVTPTGAAILRVIVDEFRQLPAMTVEAVGHGAGNDREGPMPNVLRAVLGRGGGPGADRVVCLETNLDDLVPEHFDYLMERLFEEGALDVSVQHVQMKKNRPGFLVRVLARPSDRAHLAKLLFAESTAIGVRTSDWDRLVLEREQRRVDTEYGRIGVKVVNDGEGRFDVSAEYDDCRRAARRAGVPLRDVVRAAEERAREQLS